MGVYIKGMSIPTECQYCGFLRWYPENGNIWCNATNRLMKEGWYTELKLKRPQWCPLVEVPEPHGRLIEAPDVGEYEVFDEDTGTIEISLLGLMECHRMVKDAKTVIEAEKER